ncbi:30S ribosomal protein S2 [Candidatus Beckwithbacteria bacterium]|nr:30S ribosomal protein S2 [Candidatus Beckwithbacteria bacterium]
MSSDKTDKSVVSLEKMLEAGVHFGHQAKRWYPKMAPYIWQSRDGVHIFDLLKTQQLLQEACEAVKQDMIAGKTIAYVATKRQAAAIAKEEAKRAGVPYIVSRWAGGTITNWQQVKQSIDRLKKLKSGLESGEFKQYTKKERVLLDREVTRLERLFGGIVDLAQPPQILFIIDINREKAAVAEAKHNGAKLYALVDSNVDPEPIDHPIPCNDDAVRSIKLMTEAFTNAVIEGKELAAKAKIEVTK